MSDFEVLVYKIKEPVTDHPNADRLSLIQIEGYTCISAKLEDGSHRYKQGDLVAYIPEGAVLPEHMMKDMDFWDINKDKPSFKYVKAKKLRGIFSQGILYSVDPSVTEGDNITELLGIVKYEPPIPTQMAGQILGAYVEYTMKYDFDSIQKNKNMFFDGEYVKVTEKLHGTNIQICYINEDLNDPNLFGSRGNILVTSKGLGAKGHVLKNNPANDGNLYIRILKELLDNGLDERLKSMCITSANGISKTIHLFGEVFGKGIQDLHYGYEKPTFRLFDIAVNKLFVFDAYSALSSYLKLENAPTLYSGPFSYDKMIELRDGKTTLNENPHIREGIVIRGYEPNGRKIAKFVSPDYLLRQNGTEYN